MRMNDGSLESNPQPAGSEITPPHLATYQVDSDESVIFLGGKPAIDARLKKEKPQEIGWSRNSRGWYNPREEKRFSDVVGAIRGAYTRGEDTNLVFRQKMLDLGYKVDDATILGEMPEHWNPKDPRNARFKSIR